MLVRIQVLQGGQLAQAGKNKLAFCLDQRQSVVCWFLLRSLLPLWVTCSSQLFANHETCKRRKLLTLQSSTFCPTYGGKPQEDLGCCPVKTEVMLGHCSQVR